MERFWVSAPSFRPQSDSLASVHVTNEPKAGLWVQSGRGGGDGLRGGRKGTQNPAYGPSQARKLFASVNSGAGCDRISGLFEELCSTLRALMEIRAPCPDRCHGLEGLPVRQVCKAPV